MKRCPSARSGPLGIQVDAILESSMTSNFEASKLKSWYKVVTKATNEQIQWAKDTIAGKTVPIPDDTLSSERIQINHYHRCCSSVQSSCQNFRSLLEAFERQQNEALNLAMIMSTPKDLLTLTDCISDYARCYSDLVQDLDSNMKAAQQINLEVKRKLGILLQIQKRFETRDKLYHRMNDEEKKYIKACEVGDPRIIEKRTRAEKTKTDFEALTGDLERDVLELLEAKETSLKSTFVSLWQLETGFYQRLYQIFSESGKHENKSGSRQDQTTEQRNTGSTSTAVNSLVGSVNPFDAEILSSTRITDLSNSSLSASAIETSENVLRIISKPQERFQSPTSHVWPPTGLNTPVFNDQRVTELVDVLDTQDIDLM